MPERHVVFQNGDIQLEGVIHLPAMAREPAPGVVVCHPHPLRGGDMDNAVVLAVCDGLAGAGIASLRFNFRGTGRSQGVYDEGRGEQDDVLAALEALRGAAGIDAHRTGLAGYSFGAGVALAAVARSAEVTALAAIAAPLAAMTAGFAKPWPGPKLVLVGDTDAYIPLRRVKDAIARMSPSTELVVVPGADHFFMGCEADIGAHVGRFLTRHLRN